MLQMLEQLKDGEKMLKKQINKINLKLILIVKLMIYRKQ